MQMRSTTAVVTAAMPSDQKFVQKSAGQKFHEAIAHTLQLEEQLKKAKQTLKESADNYSAELFAQHIKGYVLVDEKFVDQCVAEYEKLASAIAPSVPENLAAMRGMDRPRVPIKSFEPLIPRYEIPVTRDMQANLKLARANIIAALKHRNGLIQDPRQEWIYCDGHLQNLFNTYCESISSIVFQCEIDISTQSIRILVMGDVSPALQTTIGEKLNPLGLISPSKISKDEMCYCIALTERNKIYNQLEKLLLPAASQASAPASVPTSSVSSATLSKRS